MATWFPQTAPVDEQASSFGLFRILPLAKFQPMMAGTVGAGYTWYYGYDPGTLRFTSPLLQDGNTKIGISQVHCQAFVPPMTTGVACSPTVPSATAS